MAYQLPLPEEEVLLDRLDELFEDILDSCGDPDLPRSPFPGVTHSRKFFFNPNVVTQASVTELDQLYREELKLKDELQELMNSKIWDPETPQTNTQLSGNDKQRAIQQGPVLTAQELVLLAKARHQRFTHDVDRHAMSSGLVEAATSAPPMAIPTHTREIMEDFFEARGSPNDAELQMLRRATGLAADTVRDFCKLLAEIYRAGHVLRSYRSQFQSGSLQGDQEGRRYAGLQDGTE